MNRILLACVALVALAYPQGTCVTEAQLRSIQDALCFSDQTAWYMYHSFVQNECTCVDPDFLQQLAAMQDAIEQSNAAIRTQLGLPPCKD